MSLSHITFISTDPDRMEEVLVKVLKARKIYDSGADTFSRAPERFYDIGGTWVAVMQGAALAERSYNHVAFWVDEEELEERLAEIAALGLEVLPGRKRIKGEGRSIYFYGPDGHLIELHSGTLAERLRRYMTARP
jgi:fosfomycin resistance protein FosX